LADGGGDLGELGIGTGLRAAGGSRDAMGDVVD
jgi:hypothetical protein